MPIENRRDCSKSSARRFHDYLERVLDDADRGDFPIISRARDCEPFNYFVHALNGMHDAGDVKGIKDLTATMCREIWRLEDEEL